MPNGMFATPFTSAGTAAPVGCAVWITRLISQCFAQMTFLVGCAHFLNEDLEIQFEYLAKTVTILGSISKTRGKSVQIESQFYEHPIINSNTSVMSEMVLL